MLNIKWNRDNKGRLAATWNTPEKDGVNIVNREFTVDRSLIRDINGLTGGKGRLSR